MTKHVFVLHVTQSVMSSPNCTPVIFAVICHHPPEVYLMLVKYLRMNTGEIMAGRH